MNKLLKLFSLMAVLSGIAVADDHGNSNQGLQESMQIVRHQEELKEQETMTILE